MVKVLVDGLFARLTEGVGAAVLLIWLTRSGLAQEELDLSWISWAIAAAIILWIGLARYLGKIGCSNIKPTETLIRLPDSCPCVSVLGQGKRR
jgi:hypothetical protein